MNRTSLILAALLIAVPLTGCLDPATSAVDKLSAGDPQKVLPYLELTDEHDHKDIAAHRVAWNMELLGYDPVAPDTSKFGRYNHVVLNGDRAYMTAYALEAGGQPGLAIFDISGDDPVLMSTLETPDLTPIDVHVSADGKYAILGGHRDNRVSLPAATSTCTGTPTIDVCTPFAPGGVILVDVTDGANPKNVASYSSAPSGAHTAKILQIAGGYHVFIASYGFSYASRVASGVEILRVDESNPLGTKLIPEARFHASQMSGNDGDKRTFVHDMWIEEHPVTDQMLMYVSYWDGGVVIVDVGNPANPRQIAAWSEFDISIYGNIHFARPIGMIGERHITYAAPEFGSADHAGEAYILDTTDPTAPKSLGKWTIPGNPLNDGGYRFSPHNFDPRGTEIVYAHYHGGVWVLDLADAENPVVKAYVFPTIPDSDMTDGFEAHEDAPNIWAAAWADDGTIYASDIGTGLYHYRMVSEEPGIPPYTSFIR